MAKPPATARKRPAAHVDPTERTIAREDARSAPQADVRQRKSRRLIPVSPDGCEHGEHLVGAAREAERRSLLTMLGELKAREAKRRANDEMLRNVERNVERWSRGLGLTTIAGGARAAIRSAVRSESRVGVEFTDEPDEPSAVALFVGLASRSADDDLIVEVLREAGVMTPGKRTSGLEALRQRRREFNKWATRSRAAMLAANPRLRLA